MQNYIMGVIPMYQKLSQMPWNIENEFTLATGIPLKNKQKMNVFQHLSLKIKLLKIRKLLSSVDSLPNYWLVVNIRGKFQIIYLVFENKLSSHQESTFIRLMYSNKHFNKMFSFESFSSSIGIY